MYTVGSYLAARLSQIGLKHHFAVAGDFNLAAGAEKQAIELAEALGCAVTVMAAAKSFFPEDHPQFAGIYLGEVSTRQAREIVDWSDTVLCIGTIFNDFSTVGWTAMPTGSILIADNERVYLDGHDFRSCLSPRFPFRTRPQGRKAGDNDGRVQAHPFRAVSRVPG